MKKYLRLLRVKHYIKNICIFVTLIFGSQVFTKDFYSVFIGFIAFCLLSSSIYIINDIVDYPLDKKTASKKNEPIANNEISKKNAFFIAMLLFILSMGVNYFTHSFHSYICIIVYFILNIFYSFIGKKIPYIELFIMAVFYLLRVFFGAAILNVPVSLVLILTVTFGTLYIVIMKRIIEIRNGKERQVFKYYNEKVLRLLSIICLCCMLGCYIWWTLMKKNLFIFISIILILIIFFRYDKKAMKTINENPVEILYSDKYLFLFALLYCLFIVITLEFC